MGKKRTSPIKENNENERKSMEWGGIKKASRVGKKNGPNKNENTKIEYKKEMDKGGEKEALMGKIRHQGEEQKEKETRTEHGDVKDKERGRQWKTRHDIWMEKREMGDKKTQGQGTDRMWATPSASDVRRVSEGGKRCTWETLTRPSNQAGNGGSGRKPSQTEQITGQGPGKGEVGKRSKKAKINHKKDGKKDSKDKTSNQPKIKDIWERGTRDRVKKGIG